MSSATIKYRFRIRTRQGLLVDKLAIHGRDQADAERKLRQMYPHCEILECSLRSTHTVPRMLALRTEPSILPPR
ncbi:MAG: hypothetical protein IRY96_09635 [Burkholderiales bacterium]|nr:hypothetical protein [Burkholderiales bacterium]PZN01896.1 MAG: hypothetical protein DIU74_09135 [Pseudomonadota bacterium]